MIDLIKTLAVSVYYLIYLTLDEWMNPFFCLSLCLAAFGGFKCAQKKLEIGKKYWISLLVGSTLIYISIVKTVFQMGGLFYDVKSGILPWIYYISAFVFVGQLSNKIWMNMMCSQMQTIEEDNTKLYFGIKNSMYIFYLVSLIPVLAISPYIYARADDYSFGYHCRIAWDATGSLWEVAKAAVVMIEEAYFVWQGTFSSIFMMAIQPAVFGEKLYVIVPMFFVLIITGSSYFFLKTVLIDWLKVDKTISKICIWIYIFLVIQCIPVHQSAFFWYNGAVHYIASHCAQLCLITFLLRLYMGKKNVGNYLGCIFFAIYVGGGNLVTLVSTLLLSLTVMLMIVLTKSWKQNKSIIMGCIVYWCAMAVNLAAPGNYGRLSVANSLGLTGAFVQAFIQSLNFMFGEWMHWTLVLTVIFLSPFLWKIAGMVKAPFSYPVLVIGYSWCYLASLFFSPLYGAGMVGAGRYINIMYLQGVLLLLFDIVYLFGWMQKKYPLLTEKSLIKNEKSYLSIAARCIAIALILSYMAEPTRYLSFGCIETLKEKEALQEYAQDYWENVEMFTSGEDSLTLNSLNNIPEFIEATESEAWYSGTRLFYQYSEINFKE